MFTDVLLRIKNHRAEYHGTRCLLYPSGSNGAEPFRRSMHKRAGTFKSASSIYDLSNDRYCTVTLGQGSCRDRIGISRPLTATDLPRLSTTPLFLSCFLMLVNNNLETPITKYALFWLGHLFIITNK